VTGQKILRFVITSLWLQLAYSSCSVGLNYTPTNPW
jgi:hypothetical protein